MNSSGRTAAAVFATLSALTARDAFGQLIQKDEPISPALPNQPSAKTLRKRAKRESLRKLNSEMPDAGR